MKAAAVKRRLLGRLMGGTGGSLRTEGGATLIEVMVCAVILLIIMSVAVKAFDNVETQRRAVRKMSVLNDLREQLIQQLSCRNTIDMRGGTCPPNLIVTGYDSAGAVLLAQPYQTFTGKCAGLDRSCAFRVRARCGAGDYQLILEFQRDPLPGKPLTVTVDDRIAGITGGWDPLFFTAMECPMPP